MRLAEPGVTVNEQGIIPFAGLYRCCNRRSMGKLVRRPDDEVFERIARHLRQIIGVLDRFLFLIVFVGGQHNNPDIIKLYKDFLGEPCSELAEELLHTTYVKDRPCYVKDED